jgi:hypothetical protein
MDKTGSLTTYIHLIISHNFKIIESKWKKHSMQVNDC